MKDCTELKLLEGINPIDRETPIKYTILSPPESGKEYIFFVATNANFMNSKENKSFELSLLPFEKGSINGPEQINDPFSSFEITYDTTTTGGVPSDFEGTVGGQTLKKTVNPLNKSLFDNYDPSRGCQKGIFGYTLSDINGNKWTPIEDKEYCINLKRPQFQMGEVKCYSTGGYNGTSIQFKYNRTQEYGPLKIDFSFLNAGNPPPGLDSNAVSYYSAIGTSTHNLEEISENGGFKDYGFYNITAFGKVIETGQIFDCILACDNAVSNPGIEFSCN